MQMRRSERVCFCGLCPAALVGSHLSPLPHFSTQRRESWALPRCTPASLLLRLVHAPLTRVRAAWAALSITGHRHTVPDRPWGWVLHSEIPAVGKRCRAGKLCFSGCNSVHAFRCINKVLFIKCFFFIHVWIEPWLNKTNYKMMFTNSPIAPYL